MCTYGQCSIWNQVLALEFTPSWSKYITAPACLSRTTIPTYFPLPYFPYCAKFLLYLTLVQN